MVRVYDMREKLEKCLVVLMIILLSLSAIYFLIGGSWLLFLGSIALILAILNNELNNRLVIEKMSTENTSSGKVLEEK